MQDVVIAGHDREFAAALVFPNLHLCRRPLPGSRRGRSSRDGSPGPASPCAKFRTLFDELARQGTGSSTYVRRVIVLDEPPSIDAREITDKWFAQPEGGPATSVSLWSRAVRTYSFIPRHHRRVDILMTSKSLDIDRLVALDVHVHSRTYRRDDCSRRARTDVLRSRSLARLERLLRTTIARGRSGVWCLPSTRS